MERLPDYLASMWNPDDWGEITVVVGVSGGADSVALLCAMCEVKQGSGTLVAAHFHHGIRGAEADADETFVRLLAEKLGVEYEVGRRQRSDKTEESARQDRYEFLTNTATKWGARYVALAHTADDQAETVLHHILRGTGLAGLAGMPRSRELMPGVGLIRPLLNVRREELRNYLKQLQQPFREDSTNQDLHYTRNRLRHELFPQLAEHYSADPVAALNRLGELAHEAQAALVTWAEELANQHAQPIPNGWQLNCQALREKPQHVVAEVLITLWRKANWPRQSMNQATWQRLTHLVLTNEPFPPAEMFPGSVTAQRIGTQLRLQRPEKTGK